jgi:hypothetical protein
MPGLRDHDFHRQLQNRRSPIDRGRLRGKLRRTQCERFPLELGHCSIRSPCLKRANRRHSKLKEAAIYRIQSPSGHL